MLIRCSDARFPKYRSEAWKVCWYSSAVTHRGSKQYGLNVSQERASVASPSRPQHCDSSRVLEPHSSSWEVLMKDGSFYIAFKSRRNWAPRSPKYNILELRTPILHA